jgi:hypothetical protein
MNYKVDQELIDRLTTQIRKMRRDEGSRKLKAAKAFSKKMNKLEAEALAEIATMVGTAKHKAKGIAEKLYGPDHDRITKLFDAVYETESQ